MLILSPDAVRFGSWVWTDVAAVAVDRAGVKVVEDVGDEGPYAVFADVPERRVTIRVTRDVSADDVAGPVPGDQDELEFHTTANRSDASRRRVGATAVVTSVKHEITRARGAAQVVTLAAVSSDGSSDPITVEPA